MDSLPIQELSCIARAALFNLCISDADLQLLGIWEQRARSLPTVRCRAALHDLCLRDQSWARRVTDHLDIQFLNTIGRVRDLDEASAEIAVDLWVSGPNGEALPGLLWALCTDEREEIQGLGVRLCHEAIAIACRELIAGHRPATVPNE